MRLIEHPDRESLTLAVAQALSAALGAALRVNERAVLCLPGGSTPVPVFKALAAAPLDWDRVTVVPGDERWVPADSARSNSRLIRRNLIDEGATAATLIDLYDPALDPSEGAEAAAAKIAPMLPLSVALVGMGEDMHTASLFPGAPELTAALSPAAPAALATHPPGQPEPRVSLTPAALLTAPELLLMITGADKRAALDRAAGLTPEEAPIRALWAELIVHYAD